MLARVRWRKVLGINLNEAAWVQMAPTELRKNPGTTTAAQAMVLPEETSAARKYKLGVALSPRSPGEPKFQGCFLSVTGKARRKTEEAELLAPPPKTKEVTLPQGRRARGVCYLGLRRPPAGSGWGPPKVGGHELTQQQPRSNASAPPALRIPSLQTRAKFHGRAWKLPGVPVVT